MKKLNQKGFGVVEGLLIFVIVALIGGAGYYVYSQNKNNPEAAKSDGLETAQTSTEPKQASNIRNYKGELIGFDYPKDWVLTSEKVNYADDSITLKTADYNTKSSAFGGEVSAGGIITIRAVSTNEKTVKSVSAPYIRGSVYQSKIEDGSQKLTRAKVGKYTGVEYVDNYEGDGGVVYEFVSQGVFVLAKIDTAYDSEKTSPVYEDFQKLLDSLVLFF